MRRFRYTGAREGSFVDIGHVRPGQVVLAEHAALLQALRQHPLFKELHPRVRRNHSTKEASDAR